MIVAEGHNGLNHWRKVKQPDGTIVTESSDDRQAWVPGEVTKAGAKKRDETVAPPVPSRAHVFKDQIKGNVGAVFWAAGTSSLWTAAIMFATHYMGWW